MVLKSLLRGGAVLALAALSLAAAAEEPALDQVALPLADYLALLDQAEAREKAANDEAARREAPSQQVVEQKTRLVWRQTADGDDSGRGDAELVASSDIEAVIQGDAIAPLWLPIAGYVESSSVEAIGAAAQAAPAALAPVAGGGSVLLARQPGRYRIRAEGRAPLLKQGGRQRLTLPAVAAPVALVDVELPAELEWSAPGAVVVADTVEGGRRTLRLANKRGQVPVFEARRFFAGQEAEKVLAHTLALTLFQLLPEGPRRHDVVFYEVSRGQLASFDVELPPGLEVEQAATDEGPIVPLVDGRRLKVERAQQLTGNGYLVVSSTPADPGAAGFAWQTLEPQFEVRARYLAAATAVAAGVAPAPAAAFQQVDLEDLPATLRQALQAAELAAAWRYSGAGAGTGEARLAVQALPAAEPLPLTIAARDTTTLITVDGTLLHRELFTLPPSTRPTSALELTLPAGATLWSAKLDGEPIRPLERGGRLAVPLALRGESLTTIEVVSVSDRALAAGRDQLAIALARVEQPVLEHRWRVLLPEGRRYRFQQSALRPVPAPLALRTSSREAAESFFQFQMVEEAIIVSNETPLEDRRLERAGADGVSASSAPKEKKDAPRPAISTDSLAKNELSQLQQGLVGGVRPLPITIPESGKALYLTGVLPPADIAVVIDVKAKS